MSRRYIDMIRYNYDDFEDDIYISGKKPRRFDRSKDRHFAKQFIHQLLITGNNIEEFDDELYKVEIINR